MDNVKQSPRLPYRKQQALQTRRRIAHAARALFLERGFGSTTIEAIAERAGVAVSTVYSVFGNKRAILGEICEEWLEESDVMPLSTLAASEQDPVRRLAIAARLTRQQWERGAEVMPLFEAAAREDSEFAAVLDGWKHEKDASMRRLTSLLSSDLRGELAVDRAGDIVLALTTPELYARLVNQCGWTPDAYEAWLSSTLMAQLLGISSSTE